MQIDVPYLQNPISTLPQIVSQLPPKTQVPIPQVSVPQVPVRQVPVNLSPSNELSGFFRTAEGTKNANDRITPNAFLSGSKSNMSAIEICINICQPVKYLSVYLFNIYMAVEYRFTSCTVLLFPITYRICVVD